MCQCGCCVWLLCLVVVVVPSASVLNRACVTACNGVEHHLMFRTSSQSRRQENKARPPTTPPPLLALHQHCLYQHRHCTHFFRSVPALDSSLSCQSTKQASSH
eukprot:m.176274 g.176274  ORF g.176274 m.176274 type:complete len:103 (-) comp17938_c1_seq2:3183-3491(-)